MLSPLIAAPALDAAGHMALDEAVLTFSGLDELILRLYAWSGPACTFGYSQRWSDAKAACGPAIDPVRRATGGGIVHHDGDLTFSLVFPWDRSLAPDSVYKNVHRGLQQALKSEGLRCSLWSARAPSAVAPICFSRAERADLVDEDGMKILGGALRKKGTKGLYQGSLRAAVAPEAVIEGVTREFGRPILEIRPEWAGEGRVLETKYRSDEWNKRR